MSESIFRIPRKNNATADVVSQLEEAFSSGYYSAGDRLPCERELQKQFHVGRGTIREALRMLRQKGWTETRKGATGGTFVKQPDAALLSQNMLFLLRRSNISYAHLIEFRQCIDESVARFAIMRYTEEQVKEIKEKTVEIRELTLQEEPDLKKVIALDLELNILCAHLSGNPLLVWIIETVQTCLGSQDNNLYCNKKYIRSIGTNWVNYIDALLKRDIGRIRYLLGFHYAQLTACLSEKNSRKDI